MFENKTKGRAFLLVISSFTFIILFSCSDNSEKNKIVLEALNESIANSSKIFEKSSQTIYASFEMKLTDPAHREKAERWYPKVKQIEELTKKIVVYIDRLKTVLNKDEDFTTNKAAELYRNLKKYKHDLLKIDPEIESAFNSSLKIMTRQFDSAQHDEDEFSKTFFNSQQPEEILALLNMFQNNILITQNRVILFCHNQSTTMITDHEWITAIVGQSSSFVQPGEKIEITAGVGSFSKRFKPQILINGQEVSINESNVAVKKFYASKTTGKHFVPIIISYTDEDGKEQIIEKKVEYTVASIEGKN